MEKQTIELFNVDVQDASVKLEFLNAEQTEVLELALFRQQYDKASNTWADDDEVTERFNKQLVDGFGVVSPDELEALIGQSFELFVNLETGSAYVEEPKTLNLTKPTVEQAGDDADGVVTEVIDYETNRLVVVELPNKVRYACKYGFGKWHPKLTKYLISKTDEIKKHQQFKEQTGLNWEDGEQLVGKKARIDFKKFKVNGQERPYVTFKKLLED